MSPETRSEQLLALLRALDLATSGLKLQEISDEIGYSEDHLSRLSSRSFGEAFAPLAIRLRVERAAHGLRHRQLSIDDVASEAGYTEAAAFAKAFRRLFGLPPGAFRSSDRGWTVGNAADLHWRPEGLELPVHPFSRIQGRPVRLFAGREFVADYSAIPAEWRRLAQVLPSRLTEATDFKAMTIFHTDGMITRDRHLMRAHLGFEYRGQPLPAGFEVFEIPAGPTLVSQPTIGAAEHSEYWTSFNRDFVSKRPARRNQPGYDEYSELPADWNGVAAQVSLAVVR